MSHINIGSLETKFFKYWIYKKARSGRLMTGNHYFLKTFNRGTGEKRKVRIPKPIAEQIAEQFLQNDSTLAYSQIYTRKNLRRKSDLINNV